MILRPAYDLHQAAWTAVHVIKYYVLCHCFAGYEDRIDRIYSLLYAMLCNKQSTTLFLTSPSSKSVQTGFADMNTCSHEQTGFVRSPPQAPLRVQQPPLRVQQPPAQTMLEGDLSSPDVVFWGTGSISDRFEVRLGE